MASNGLRTLLRPAFACIVLTRAFSACGGRSGLEVDPPDEPGVPAADATIDAPRDAAFDVPARNDAGSDSPVDATNHDATSDESAAHAPPPDTGLPDSIAQLPPIDAAPPVDGGARCVDGGAPTAYLLSATAQLLLFAPATVTSQVLGTLACPAGGSAPWTMAVSSTGVAYVMYTDWNIYQVDLSTLECTPTSYQPGQLSFPGDVSISIAPSALNPSLESFFVYGSINGAATLGASVLPSFSLDKVGPISPDPGEYPVDMQSDAFGRLFAVSRTGIFVQIDASTGQVVGRDDTGFLAAAGGWAVMTWNGRIYFFGDGGSFFEYDLSSKTLLPRGDVGDTIVGASAVPCLSN